MNAGQQPSSVRCLKTVPGVSFATTTRRKLEIGGAARLPQSMIARNARGGIALICGPEHDR